LILGVGMPQAQVPVGSVWASKVTGRGRIDYFKFGGGEKLK
jgi:hypothetical protein